jgi:RHS repeat-associated protein
MSYDSDGRTDTVTFANGIVADYGYDNASQLTSLTYSRGATVIGDLYYEYDVTGRRVKVGGSLAQVAFPPAMSNGAYDAANRLTSWAGTSLTYDLNGNLTNDGARTFTWDSRNRMKTIAGAATASFGYDGLSRRTSTTVSGGSKSFVYDDLDIVAEIVGGAVSATSMSSLGLDDTLLRTDGAGERTPLVDALGSTIALTDATGAVRTSYRYEPYGTTIASGDPSGNPVQFTGRENDGTGLYYYRSRYYNPVFGRFVAEDPLGLVAGMNLYGYVDGDPISFVDPLGLNACKIEYIGYPITLPGTNTQVPLGHAGVLSYDPETGDTRYYEYGRYGDDFGSVERREVPDLDIDPKTGKPTPESWKKLKDYLRKKLGKGHWMTTLCDDEADFDKVNDFAEKRMHDPNRKPYEWNPLKGVNQCFSFADEAIKAGRAGKRK